MTGHRVGEHQEQGRGRSAGDDAWELWWPPFTGWRHEPMGWRPTLLEVTVRRYRCADCDHATHLGRVAPSGRCAAPGCLSVAVPGRAGRAGRNDRTVTLSDQTSPGTPYCDTSASRFPCDVGRSCRGRAWSDETGEQPTTLTQDGAALEPAYAALWVRGS
jgi:transposase